MDKNNLKQLFPDLEDGLYNELVEHGTIKNVKAGETLLRVGQTIRSTMLIIEGSIKLYEKTVKGKNSLSIILMQDRPVLFLWYVQQSMKQVK